VVPKLTVEFKAKKDMQVLDQFKPTVTDEKKSQ